MSDIDYPTTGGFGQTNKQWSDGKSQYEVMEDRRNKLRNQTNQLEQKQDALKAFLIEIKVFATVMGDGLTKAELDTLRRQYNYYSKKENQVTISLNDSRNALKRSETDLYNFKQRR